jgi:3-methyladenine DNA glycosylase/8-oxoguanine DNA glycosylase
MVEWRAIGRLELVGAGGEPVDLRRTLASHGVASLLPQHIDEAAGTLETTLARPDGAGAHRLRIRTDPPSSVAVEVPRDARLTPADPGRLTTVARHLLALDEDLSPFYARAARDPALAWVTAGAGRMLRSPSVFESVVKTICTTNCAWSATIRMVSRIVEGLGPSAPDGSKAFPSPAAMAGAGEDFYRDVVRAGYRSGNLQRLAAEVAEGRLDLEALGDPAMPSEEVRARLLALPGVGPYAAAHVMLISLGRYKDLVLDSWTRPTFAALTGKAAGDAAIEQRFKRFGDWAGLAFWLFLTKGWVEE